MYSIRSNPHLPDLFTMYDKLIASPSVSSVNPEFDMGNRVVIDQLETWLNDVGFTTRRQAVDEGKDKWNLIAVLGDAENAEGLILAGHTDTVPYDDTRWNTDPFRCVQKDARLYGLGSSDMKGFFPLVLEAIKQLAGQDLQRPLIVLATSDEESTMAGARQLVEQESIQARYAVIGEPTGLRPIRMHKGVMMESIIVHGQSGHSSNPAYGNNAMEGMYKVIGALMDWRTSLQARYQHALFEVATPTMNLGHIHGGDNPNRICGECELQIDLRLLPGMQVDDVRAEINQHVSDALSGSGLTYDLHTLTEAVPAMETSASSKIVKAAEMFSGNQSGSVAFATEGPFLDQLGIETVILGAGDIAQAHQPDEYVSLDRLAPTISILRKLIQQFCIEPTQT